jgi:signal transduction histidine kinase
MNDTLDDEGYEVVEAATAAEALQFCEPEVPHLLIVDAVMPEMDGFELCQALRSRADMDLVPILMATGLDEDQSVSKAYDAGATDFISKPLNWLLLTQRVRYMLRAAKAFSDLRRSQERLLHAKEAAEAANQAKAEFLSTMGHELRTPLNAIIGFSSILRDGQFGPINEQYAEYARYIADSGAHLLANVNDILDFARSESRRIVLAEESVDIGQVVNSCLEAVEEMARTAQIQMSVSVQKDLPLFVGEVSRLKQILVNLLSNAIKFSPGRGKVEVIARQNSDGGLDIAVADTGIGISADDMDVALAPFGQVDSSLNRNYEGIGIGLPLTKRLVELHQGSLIIDSEPNKGTTITVRFPADRLQSGAGTQVHANAAGTA